MLVIRYKLIVPNNAYFLPILRLVGLDAYFLPHTNSI